MFGIQRPALGGIVIIIVAISLALSTLGCAKKETNDSWQMTPPVFETSNAGGLRLKIKSTLLATQSLQTETLLVDESAVLTFTEADRGLPLRVKSRCTSSVPRVESHTVNLATASVLSILDLVPTLVLSPESLMHEWRCDFQMRVTNSHGSVHDFGFPAMRIHFVRIAHRMKMSPLLADLDTEILSPRRLICDSWWTEARRDSLTAMAQSASVTGVDSREFERQPLCTVVATGSVSKVDGFFRPIFNRSKNSISISDPEILIPNSELSDLYRRSLFSWTVRNDSHMTQTLFIATSNESVTFAAVMAWQEPNGGVFNPVRIFPLLSAIGPAETRQTPNGLYVRLHPGASIALRLNSNRPDITSLVDFSRTVGTSHLIMNATDFSLATLANEQSITSLGAADLISLERQPLDSVKYRLLTSAVLEPDRALGKVVFSRTTREDLNAKKRIPATDCFITGQLLNPQAPPCR